MGMVLTSCSKSDDCECKTTDYFYHTETKTVEDEESGEEYVDTIDVYEASTQRDFLFKDWDKDCEDITLQDVPEKWNGAFADSCRISCKDK